LAPSNLRNTSLEVKSDSTAFQKYLSLGNKLKAVTEVGELLYIIKAIEDKYPLDWSADPDDYMPFIYIDGSSGLGKTQMAFNLMAALGQRKPVHYVLASEVKRENRVQNIYRSFANRSKAFEMCVSKDVDVLWRNGDVDFINLADHLLTYGFIEAIINQRSGVERGLTRKEILERIAHIQAKGVERPIWYVDEIPSVVIDFEKESKEVFRLRFMRNIFRSLGFVVIQSSTSTSADINARIGQAFSRGEGGATHWCTIIPNLPGFQIDVNHRPSHSAWTKILLNSRPLFSEFAQQFYEASKSTDLSFIDFMDLLSKKLAHSARDWKYGLEEDNLHFLHGQVCLFLCPTYIKKCQAESQLVHKHFGVLFEHKPFDLYYYSGRLRRRIKGGIAVNSETFDPAEDLAEKKWTSATVFPEVEKDVLLYLCLMGGKDHNAIELGSGSRQPFARALGFFLGRQRGELKVNLEHDNQVVNDGMEWEATVAGAIILASHGDGFSGTSIRNLLPRILYELDVCVSSDFVLQGRPELDQFLTCVVPFLSPVNRAWPEYLENWDLNVAKFERSKNRDQVDFKTQTRNWDCQCKKGSNSSDGCKDHYLDFLLSGECKDHKTPIGLSVMEGILKRALSTSQIHLVFVRKLQKEYYKRKAKSFEHFLSGLDGETRKVLSETVIFQLCAEPKAKKITFQPIPGLEAVGLNDTPAKRLILFIPKDDLKKLFETE
jgi:hypothetical protein